MPGSVLPLLLGGPLLGLVAVLLGVVGAALWLDARGQRPIPRDHYDALIVAGCRVMSDGRPSPALARRVCLAVALYHEGYAPRIVLTGGVGEPPPPLTEAEAAARLCLALGVPSGALIREGRSRTTLENAAFAAELIQGEVLVISDTSHVFRCQRMFARCFERADAVGVLGPQRARVRLALREVAAVVGHGLRGRL